MTPIFLFSLPRSGSTLLQRVLASHESIRTVSEPWILLPLLYSTKTQGTYAEYMHFNASQAVRDFVSELPNGRSDYLDAVRSYVMTLYKKAANKEVRFFLDKTPRYHLIVDDILELFPDGKFIFLWRNPLAVLASIMRTWGRNRWNLYRFRIDLFNGVSCLCQAQVKYANKVHIVRYEDLISSPQEALRNIFAYLEIDFSTEDCLKDFANMNLKGLMGDPTGVKEYSSIATEPLDKWKDQLSNPIRKIWCRRYLRWIGAQRLEMMGYELNELSDQLRSINTSAKYLFSDMFNLPYGQIFAWMEPAALRDKLRSPFDPCSIHFHN